MENRTLGGSALHVSVVGLGCNNLGRPGTLTFEQEGADAVVHAALDAGVTFFDTADIYGAEYGLSETRLGAALRGRRDEVPFGPMLVAGTFVALVFGDAIIHGYTNVFGVGA